MQKIRARLALGSKEQLVGAGEEKEKQTWKREQVSLGDPEDHSST